MSFNMIRQGPLIILGGTLAKMEKIFYQLCPCKKNMTEDVQEKNEGRLRQKKKKKEIEMSSMFLELTIFSALLLTNPKE